jgi:hypothetical protein
MVNETGKPLPPLPGQTHIPPPSENPTTTKIKETGLKVLQATAPDTPRPSRQSPRVELLKEKVKAPDIATSLAILETVAKNPLETISS